MEKIEITGLKKTYVETYNIKHKNLILIDFDNNVNEEIDVIHDAFKGKKTLKFDRLGVSLKKPENKHKFIDHNKENIYYRYDLENNEQIDKNIQAYNEQLKAWNNRNKIEKMKDYIGNKEFEAIFEKEVVLEPMEMFISQLNPKDNNIHDETVSIIKIQALSKKKEGMAINIMKYLPYIGVFLLIVICLVGVSYFRVRLW